MTIDLFLLSYLSGIIVHRSLLNILTSWPQTMTDHLADLSLWEEAGFLPFLCLLPDEINPEKQGWKIIIRSYSAYLCREIVPKYIPIREHRNKLFLKQIPVSSWSWKLFPPFPFFFFWSYIDGMQINMGSGSDIIWCNLFCCSSNEYDLQLNFLNMKRYLNKFKANKTIFVYNVYKITFYRFHHEVRLML